MSMTHPSVIPSELSLASAESSRRWTTGDEYRRYMHLGEYNAAVNTTRAVLDLPPITPDQQRAIYAAALETRERWGDIDRAALLAAVEAHQQAVRR